MSKPRAVWQVPVGCAHISSRHALSSDRMRLAERLAFEHGEGYDSYLALQDGLQYFFGRGDEGMVAFTTWRNHAYIVGGLLTPRDRKGNLLRDVLDFAKRNRLEVSFLNVLAADVHVFREEAFCISKVGEEPLVDLRGAMWEGKDYAWVRRQENFCCRQGVIFEELSAEDLPLAVAELEDVSREHLDHTVYGRELAMMVGRADLGHLFRRRLFVARHQGRIEAFAIANPAYGGRFWAVETFRKRPSATRGVIPFLISQIARLMRSEGVSYLSLCQVPALRVDRGSRSDSRFVRDGLNFWFRRLPWFYDVPRLYHFKSRFRPQYRECFIATHPEVRLLPMLAFFVKWGILIPRLSRLPVQIARRMQKWTHREHLADPRLEEYVIVERLQFPVPVAVPAVEQLLPG